LTDFAFDGRGTRSFAFDGEIRHSPHEIFHTNGVFVLKKKGNQHLSRLYFWGMTI